MFILIKAKEGVLSLDNIVTTYDSYDLAYRAMVREVEEAKAYEGIELKEQEPNNSDLYDMDGIWQGSIFDLGADLDFGWKYSWRIFEI